MIGRGFYTLLLHLALPWVLARLAWRARREPAYARALHERFGRYAAAPVGPVLWVHAVSVGEVRGSAPLVRALAAARPDIPLLLTCSTAAGRETALQVHGEAVHVAWLPYDLPWAIAAFLARFRPLFGVIVETEIWPNLIAACARAGIPLLLANARMSRRSARGYRRFARLTRPAIAAIDAVCAQGARSARRLRWLGARRVLLTGNLKFDVTPNAGTLAAGRAMRESLGARPVVLLASTRDGEEDLLLDAMRVVPHGALVVLVPRHPRRFEAVAQALAARGLATTRRSTGQAPSEQTQVFLGDSMGEMDFYYGLADVAVIGGSFKPLGGQNLIEACACGTPVIIGPSTYNFPEAVTLAEEAGAASRVTDAAGAAQAIHELLSDPPRREQMSRAGLALCATHRGATARHLEVCNQLLAGRKSQRH